MSKRKSPTLPAGRPRFANWTPEADALVKDLYEQTPGSVIRARLDADFGITVSASALNKRARKIGASTKRRGPHLSWTDAMVEDLKAMTADGVKLADIASELSRRHGRPISFAATKEKRRAMGIIVQPHNRWTNDAEDVLYTHAATMTLAQLRGHIHRTTGMTFTEDAIRSHMCRLGIYMRHSDDEVIATDIANELGISTARVLRFVNYRGLPARNTARYVYLPPETQEVLRQTFPKMPEPVMTSAEASKALGYSASALHKLVRLGQLRGYKFGNATMLAVAAVEAKRRELGITRPLPQTFGRAEQPKRTAS